VSLQAPFELVRLIVELRRNLFQQLPIARVARGLGELAAICGAPAEAGDILGDGRSYSPDAAAFLPLLVRSDGRFPPGDLRSRRFVRWDVAQVG